MVQLEEVEDDELNQSQPGPTKEEEDEWDTDTGTTSGMKPLYIHR